MTKGPRRLVLDQYLDSAAPGAVKNAGRDWKEKADDLAELGEALRKAAAQAELRIGEQTLTGPALRAGMEESAVSMLAKSDQLRAAGEALRQVGQQIADTRDVRDSLADLGEKPTPYQAPPGTPGVETTPEELKAQSEAAQARTDERTAWQTQYDKQEAKALALTREMDAAFLGAIPPMKDIHGHQDPTEPPPTVPSGPGGTYLPGTQAPAPTGTSAGAHFVHTGDKGGEDGNVKNPPNLVPTTVVCTFTTPTVITHVPTEVPTTTTTTTTPTIGHPTPTTHVPTETPTTTVIGSSQDGISFQPGGGSVPTPSSAAAGGGMSAGTSAAALGAAGGAGGGMAAGAIRPGAAPTSATRGATPVRAIGSTARAGSAGALSRSAGSAGSAGSNAARAGSAGSPASRGAGSAGGRGAASGSTAGRGGAGGRSAGSSAGSRSGGRGSTGARGAGVGGASGRGGRRGEDEKSNDRDSLVYDQDWLGDDDVAPGVLD